MIPHELRVEAFDRLYDLVNLALGDSLLLDEMGFRARVRLLEKAEYALLAGGSVIIIRTCHEPEAH